MMNSQRLFRMLKQPVLIGLFIFIALLVLSQFLTYQRYLLLKEARKQELMAQATRAKEGLQTVMSYSFSTTKTLAFIVEKYGIPKDFDSVAKQLLNVNPYIDMVELVQGGTITHVFPAEGNESVIGFNILLDSARKSGAIATIVKRDFFVAGPIHLKQGGIGFVSRVPIFTGDQFRGFAAAVIKLSTLLEAAGIDTSGNDAFSYQLAKADALTGKEEFFFRQRYPQGKGYVIPVVIPNGEWRLYVSENHEIGFSAVFLFALLGFLLSFTGGFFSWYIASQPSRLNKLVEEKTSLLQSSEKKYRITLERLSDAFVALDVNWCYTYMNSKAGEFFRCDPAKMTGQHIWTVLREGINHPFYESYSKAMELQQYVYAEEYYAPSDCWLEHHIYPSPDGLSVFFHDITAKKKAEKELQQANHRFELISKTTNDAVWEWDLETGQLWSNETNQYLYGLTMADPVPDHKQWAERIHPEDRDAVVRMQEKTMVSDEHVFITEYRFLTEHNGYRNLYDRSYILRNKDGKAIRLMGSMMDITERIQAEEALRTSEEQYRQIVETAQEGIWMIDAGNVTSFINRRMASMLGYTKEEMLGRSLFDFMDEEGRRISERNIERRKQGIAEDHGFKLTTKDGRDLWTLMSTNPIMNNGVYRGALAMVTDITEHKKAEDQVFREKELSDSIINSLPGIFYLFDANKSFLRWNKNFETVSGYNAEELKLVQPIDFFENEGRVLVQKNFALAMVTGESAFEANFVTKTGEKIPYYFTGKLVTYEGQPCIIGTGIDLTERKKAEKALRESELLTQNILTSVSSHIAVVNEDGTVVAVNKAWTDFSKENGETVLERTGTGSNYIQVCEQAIANGDKIAEQVLKGIQQVMYKELPTFEIEYPCDSPFVKRWFLLRITSYSGDTPKVVMVHFDITERKLSEMNLQKALDRYEFLAKATSDTVWDWDMQTHMMHYNEGITTMLGYQKSVVENIPDWWKQQIHPDDLSAVSELLEDAFATRKQNIQLSYRFLCANSNYKYIFDRAFVVYDEQGKPTRLIGAMQDVTHETQEEMRISEAIVEAQEAERQQLGMELHDNVNQILSVSLLYLGLAKEQQGKEAEFSGTLDITKKHISDAIHEIRKLSHQLAPATTEDVSLKDVFESLTDSLTSNSKTDVRLHFDDVELQKISIDIQTALFRILQEQLNNIFKHADAGAVDIWLTVSNGAITLRIRDNGKGFDQKQVHKGIGLRNMKRRAEMYQGRFVCNSSPGQGCELIVTIPLVKKK